MLFLFPKWYNSLRTDNKTISQEVDTMKKFFALLLAVVLAFSVAACGEAKAPDRTEAIRTAADGFLSAIESGDFEKVSEFASEEVMDDFNLDQLDGMVDSFFNEMGVDSSAIDESVKEKLNSFVETMKENFLTSYEIKDVSEKDGKGIVKADLSLGFNFDEIQNMDLSGDLEGIVSDYMTEHMAELVELAGDEAALMSKVITDLAPVMLDKYSEEMLATGGGTEEVILTLEEKDGKWLVTGSDGVE